MGDFIGPLSHHIHTSKPVSYSRAQKWINAYTARSQQHPHMHPDAQLSRKIDFGTSGATGNVRMKQMRKLSQGLSGERLTPEPEEKKKKDHGGQGHSGESGVRGNASTAEAKVDEGQDADQWAEQRGGLEVGEIGRRDNYVGQVEGNVVPRIHTSVETPVEEQDAVAREEEAGDVQEEATAKLVKKEKRKAEKQESPTKRRKVRDDD